MFDHIILTFGSKFDSVYLFFEKDIIINYFLNFHYFLNFQKFVVLIDLDH